MSAEDKHGSRQFNPKLANYDYNWNSLAAPTISVSHSTKIERGHQAYGRAIEYGIDSNSRPFPAGRSKSADEESLDYPDRAIAWSPEDVVSALEFLSVFADSEVDCKITNNQFADDQPNGEDTLLRRLFDESWIPLLAHKVATSDLNTAKVTKFTQDILEIFPDLSDRLNAVEVHLRFAPIFSSVKTVARERNTAFKEKDSLTRTLETKERKLEEKVADLIRSWGSKGAREEKLSKEVDRLELALDKAKQDLKNAAYKAKNDLIEWKNKIGKRNRKIHDLNAQVAGRKRRQSHQAKGTSGAFQGRIYFPEGERDELQLKLSRISQGPDCTTSVVPDHSEKSVIAERELQKPETANDETFESHLQQEAEYKKTIATLEGQLTEMEEVQNTTLNELENLRLSTSLVEENTSCKIHDLEAQLAEERAKSGHLEQRLTPFLLAAVAAHFETTYSIEQHRTIQNRHLERTSCIFNT
ncbi:hypothetical protein DL98DRAFT_584525 [Cadophora sp. DSE1049]|nr:hypothetical protein DL98DRAFT_584525 [Cadophora sp. DSE1049]